METRTKHGQSAKMAPNQLTQLVEKIGAGERNRTSNLWFTKPLLCRLSYASPLQKENHIIEKMAGTVDEEIQPRNGSWAQKSRVRYWGVW